MRILPLLCSLLIITSLLSAGEHAAVPGFVRSEAEREAWRIGWPNFHGPFCNGRAIDLGYQLVDDFTQARTVWENDILIPPSDKTQNPSSLVVGYGTPVVADGRVYQFYTYPTGLDPAETLAKDKVDYPTEADEFVLCVEAASGKTLWHRKWEMNGVTVTGSNKQGGHYTMAIADGRAYAFGSTGRIYCLDAVTGESLWETHNHPEVHAPNATPMVAEGVLVYRVGGTLIGYDGRTGEKRWSLGGVARGTRDSAPTKFWRVGKRTLLVHLNQCIDPQNGTVVWDIGPSEGANGSAIQDGYMVTSGADNKGKLVGPRGFRVSPQGAELIWQWDQPLVMKGFSAPTFIDGWAAVDMHSPEKGAEGGKDQVFALFELATGRAVTMPGHYKAWKYQPISAEGRYLYTAGYNFWIAKLDPDDLRELSNTKVSFSCDVSPAYTCGLMFIRGDRHLMCYDLRRK